MALTAWRAGSATRSRMNINRGDAEKQPEKKSRKRSPRRNNNEPQRTQRKPRLKNNRKGLLSHLLSILRGVLFFLFWGRQTVALYAYQISLISLWPLRASASLQLTLSSVRVSDQCPRIVVRGRPGTTGLLINRSGPPSESSSTLKPGPHCLSPECGEFNYLRQTEVLRNISLISF